MYCIGYIFKYLSSQAQIYILTCMQFQASNILSRRIPISIRSSNLGLTDILFKFAKKQHHLINDGVLNR